MAGKTWWRGFKKRHPQLIVKGVTNLSLARAMGANKPGLDSWFDKLEMILRKQRIIGQDPASCRPSCIWNIDEKGLEDIPHVRRVVGLKGQDTFQLVAGEKGSRSTVLTFINGDGDHVPPLVIHKGKRLNPEWNKDKPQDVMLKCSESGYINKQIFVEYGSRFIRYLNSKNILGQPQVLLMDSHFSHLYNYQFMSLMKDYSITHFISDPEGAIRSAISGAVEGAAGQ